MTIYKRYLTLSMMAALLTMGSTQAADNTHTWAEHSVLASGTWVKIALTQAEDGIFQISYSDLKKWGFNNPSQVAVFGFGGHVLPESLSEPYLDDLPEVATLHDAERSRILFYGRGLTAWNYDATKGYVQRQHPYALMSKGSYAYYFLHQKEDGAPLTIASQASDTIGQNTLVVDDYDEHWLHETAEANIGKAGQEWYGESFLLKSAQSFILPEENVLQGHVLKKGTARLTVNFVTKSSVNTSLQVGLNGTILGSIDIGASSEYGTEGSFEKTLNIAEDLDGAQVSLTYTAGNGSPSVARLNYIRLQGKSPLEASSKEPYMLFRNAQAIKKQVAYRIQGLTTQMQVWDVTSPTDIKRQALLGDTLFVASDKGLREYAVVNLQSSTYPTVGRVYTLSKHYDLHSIDSVDMVIVAPSGYITQADSLARYRSIYDRMNVAVVSPEAIYNEFSSGVPDATAIRLFAKRLYDRKRSGQHQFRYLLLWGDGSYDNYTACTSNYLLPSYENQNSLSETGSSVTDDYFGFLDDNEGASLATANLDIAVGRLPVSSVSESEQVLAKIINYDKNRYGSWRNRICLVADDEKIENGSLKDPINEHVSHCDELAGILEEQGHKELAIQKIYLPAYQRTTSSSGTDYPDARKDLNSALQEGVLLLDYAGHGASNNIAHEQLITVSQARQLRMSHLPVWILASCNVSRWDNDEESLGEALLLNPNGGAAAVISATREVYMSNNRYLNRQMFSNLCQQQEDGTPYRLGDMLKQAKRALTSDANKLSYGLLGDPSMSLAMPDQRVVVDSVQGDFKTLGQVTVFGHVCKPNSVLTDTTFAGLLYSTIYDAADTLTCDQGLWNGEEVFTFGARKRRLFTGRSIIKGGTFEFSFKMPQDISAGNGTGLMNFYAWSSRYTEANGYYENFNIERDPSADTMADTEGPKIVFCFMDSPDFKDGDLVSMTPYFYAEVYDPSGINATGNSIGHDVSLTIKCLSNPIISTRQYVLNNQFTTFTGVSNYGNVKYSLTDLQEGTYEGTFRVWDVYNNVSSRTFTFKVSNQARPAIASMLAYPSPARQGSTVTFQILHDRPESADQLRLQVYTQSGIKVLDKTVSTSSCEVVYQDFDAKDKEVYILSNAMNGDETHRLMGRTTLTWNVNVAAGVYMYRAYLSAGSEEIVTKAKKLIVY